MKHLPLRCHEYRQIERDFRQWLMLLGYAESSVYNLPTHVREFFHFLEQRQIITIQQLHADYVQQFFEQVQQRPNQRRSGGLSENHLNKYIQALKLLARFLQTTAQGYLPVELTRIRVARRVEGTLTQQEVQSLYDCCDTSHPVGLRDRAMLSIYYGCGLRRSEGTGLDIGDVLLRKKLLYVRKGKNYQERYIPMNPRIIADLQMYLHEARPLLLGKLHSPALLISERGRRVESQTLALRLKQLQQWADMPDKTITLHSLRHSIATHLLQSGMPLQDIARFLGHRSLEATQIYTHILDEDTRGV